MPRKKGIYMKKHSCRTHFRISGFFDVQNVLDALQVSPYRVVRRGDALPVANRFAVRDTIDIGFNNSYHVDVNEMIRVTLKDLIPKIDTLVELKKAHQLEYYLVIVPEIEHDSEEPAPLLSLDDDIIEFLYLTKTKHDVDYYIY